MTLIYIGKRLQEGQYQTEAYQEVSLEEAEMIGEAEVVKVRQDM